jgi:hypothetical protein
VLNDLDSHDLVRAGLMPAAFVGIRKQTEAADIDNR